MPAAAIHKIVRGVSQRHNTAREYQSRALSRSARPVLAGESALETERPRWRRRPRARGIEDPFGEPSRPQVMLSRTFAPAWAQASAVHGLPARPKAVLDTEAARPSTPTRGPRSTYDDDHGAARGRPTRCRSPRSQRRGRP